VIHGEVWRGRPYVTGFVVLPRLIIDGEVAFLVDTGADTTVIYPRDAERLRLSHEQVFADSNVVFSVGIGGGVEEYLEGGFAMIQHDDGKWDQMLAPLHFAVPSAAYALIPSLLGRDVLSYYKLVFDQRAGLVTLENAGA
jgi:hypothetical protein